MHLTSTNELRLRLLEASDIHLVKPIWTSLYDALSPGAVTTSWDWVGTWIDIYGDLVPYFFVVGERSGEPSAIVLVTEGVDQKIGPIPVSTLNIGTSGEPVGHGVFVEYNRVICRPDDLAVFAKRLMRFLRALPRGHRREIILHGFVPEDADPFIAANPHMFVRREPCPNTDLAAIRADNSTVLGALRKNTRNKITRAFRLHGEITTEWCDTETLATEVFDDLVRLHQRRWTAVGQQGAFGSDRFLAFHRQLIPKLLASKNLLLVRAKTETGTIGCVYGFIEWKQVLFYQSGFSAGESEKHHPGLVTNALAMQMCLDRGYDDYNFMAGQSRYKDQLTTTRRELVWTVDAPAGIKTALLMAARRRRFADTFSPAGARALTPS